MKHTLLRTRLLLLLLLCSWGGAFHLHAQRLIAKTNLLYLCSGTLNAGLEFRLSRSTTFNLEGQYNPLTFGDKSLKHYALQPELRVWPSGRPQARWFYGFMGNLSRKECNLSGTYRFVDSFGGGVSGGYVFVLKERLRLETTLAFGLVMERGREWETTQPLKCNVKGLKFSPLKAGVTLTYILK